jgi:hypothetical protein
VYILKLGKVLDLSKCFYDKDHWTHPDLKEDQLYIVTYTIVKRDNVMMGTFDFTNNHWVFRVNGGLPYYFGPYENDESPIQEGWKHIQEVIL